MSDRHASEEGDVTLLRTSVEQEVPLLHDSEKPISPGFRSRHGRSNYISGLLRPRRRSLRHLLLWFIITFFTSIFTAIFFTGTFFPSYLNPPARYDLLSAQTWGSDRPGRSNPINEKVFVAASIYDDHGGLVAGAWGDAVIQLIDLLGPDNVFLSIYENDADADAKKALASLEKRLACNFSLVTEDYPYSELPHIETPTGQSRIKRIAFLADVRNRALAPLHDASSLASSISFDKILFLNDIAFRPLDAAQLLFNTHIDPVSGRTDYRAACAVDFINPFKFYDTFATRDAEGREIGLPFYPFFGAVGHATSRADVLAQSDAVRVKSCWGGMVAFDATYMTPLPSVSNATTTAAPPLRFRAEDDLFWDASECCLIHADLAALPPSPASPSANAADVGIYMNPFVRVAYDPATLSWLPFTQRFERLYPLLHGFLSAVAKPADANPRRLEQGGEIVVRSRWQGNQSSFAGGEWVREEKMAKPGGFCGKRMLLTLNEHPGPDERRWETVLPPSGWEEVERTW